LFNTITIQSDSNNETLEIAAVQPALKKPMIEEIIMAGRLSDAHIDPVSKNPPFSHIP